MIIDTKNILRQDLSHFYAECERITSKKARALELDPDVFVINENDYPDIHSFAMLGASLIADSSDMVKLASQTGIDALTIDIDEDTGQDIKEYPAADATTGLVPETMGKTHEDGEKMVPTLTDQVIFSIEGLDDTQKRYTVVQEFIKEAMIRFVLYKWYDQAGRLDLSRVEYQSYEEALKSVKYNSVRNHKAKSACKPYRLF